MGRPCSLRAQDSSGKSILPSGRASSQLRNVEPTDIFAGLFNASLPGCGRCLESVDISATGSAVEGSMTVTDIDQTIHETDDMLNTLNMSPPSFITFVAGPQAVTQQRSIRSTSSDAFSLMMAAREAAFDRRESMNDCGTVRVSVCEASAEHARSAQQRSRGPT